MARTAKVVVIGAGIGGLTAAALLAQAGLEVTVLEANTYPGGCAGTFYHKGYRFDAGATVVGGFQANGPHTLVGEQLKIDWSVLPSEPAWVVHLPERSVALSRDNADMIAQFPRSKAFWEEQAAIADITWSLAASGLPFPPTNCDEWFQLLRVSLSHFPRDLRLLPYLLTTTHQWLRHHKLTDDPEFVRLIDAQLLISAQTTIRHANALYSTTALDLARQGTYHVKGGVGTIARTLADKLIESGGQVFYRRQVRKIEIRNGRICGVQVQTGKRALETSLIPADFVIANLTPASLDSLLGEASPPKLQRQVRHQQDGWGAFVLHFGVQADKLPVKLPDHHQMIVDMDSPLGEGKSLFLSFSPEWDSSRAPAGHRAVTVTTHTDVRSWWELPTPDAYEVRKLEYTERMLSAIDQHLPGFRRSISLQLTGTPITYAYYTGRHNGLVGGFPQTSLLRARGARTGISNLRVVGDSIFPGQSTAGVTLGAVRVAKDVLRSLSRYEAEDAFWQSQAEMCI